MSKREIRKWYKNLLREAEWCGMDVVEDEIVEQFNALVKENKKLKKQVEKLLNQKEKLRKGKG